MSAFDLWDELDRGEWQQLSQWRADAKPEGLHHDYKEANWTGKDISDDDRKNLAKNLSGFGNVDGGVIIFGAGTTIDATTKLETLSSLSGVSPLDQYEERLRIFVKTSTVPPVPGVIVKSIKDRSQTNRGVVLVYIPVEASDAAPFRAQCPKPDINDRYFMRTTSDTLVMPHQILSAMFGRRPLPRLRVGFHRTSKPRVVVIVDNVGRGPAVTPFVRLKHLGQAPLQVFPRGSWVEKKYDAVLPNSDWQLGFGLPPGELIYPLEQRQVAAVDVSGDEPNWTVRIDCENAQPVHLSGAVKLEKGKTVWLDPPIL